MGRPCICGFAWRSLPPQARDVKHHRWWWARRPDGALDVIQFVECDGATWSVDGDYPESWPKGTVWSPCLLPPDDNEVRVGAYVRYVPGDGAEWIEGPVVSIAVFDSGRFATIRIEARAGRRFEGSFEWTVSATYRGDFLRIIERPVAP